MRAIVSYAGPIVPINVLESLIPLTERYVIQFVAGPAAVGVYAATQNLVQQPINMLTSAIAIAAFPIIMRSAEVDGLLPTRARMGEVGGYLLALALPAVAGLIMLRNEIVDVVLGEQFRAEATLLIPWMSVTALMVALKYHYFDVVFHVTRRTMIQVATLLPAMLLTAPFIYIFLKTWGLPGAAAAVCLAFTASVISSWMTGRRLITIPHAFSDAVRITLAVGVMIFVLWLLPPVPGLQGLIVHVAIGGCAYALTALALNVLQLRSVAFEYFARLATRPVSAS